MKPFVKIETWGNHHHPVVMDVVRIVLGLFLIVKGIVFLNNAGYLHFLILEKQAINQPEWLISFIIFYVTYVHLVGGVAILLGLFTRVAALFQIPIVFGAVFLVNILSSFVNSELWLSVLVLALLVVFVIIGSGPLSIDRYIFEMRNPLGSKD